MSVPKGSKAAQFRGFNNHIHVTVSAAQAAKLRAKASKTGTSLSVLVRGLIDDMEVSK